MAESLSMIVVLISEGRKFPYRSSHQLLFEARFDGELLCTDGVDHLEFPEVTQELAWQINRKTLQQHKLQRTPIKILCYAVDKRSSVKEQIGYIVLDLRSAPAKPTKKWYHLLNTKYKKSKPELKVAVYIEPIENPLDNPSLVSEKSHDSGEVDLSTLVPILNEADGVFQLGPPTRCKDIFILSITVAFAGHLANLLPDTRNISIDPEGFYFFYTLFDNDVITEKFLDLLDPKLTAERASIRLRSSFDVLRYFFQNIKPIEFHLCTGDTSLGSASVNLTSLIKDADDISFPLLHEGVFELHAPNKFKKMELTGMNGEKPVIGVSVQIKREHIVQADSGMCLTEPVAENPEKGNPSENTADEYSTNTFASAASSITSLPTDHPATDKEPNKIDDQTVKQQTDRQTEQPASLATSSERTQFSTQPHHYEFSLEIKSIRRVLTDHHIFIYMRYRYPPFGSLSPYTTHPAIEVSRDTEHLFANSYCCLTFSKSPGEMRDVVYRYPFEVELWLYNQMSGNKCLGMATLPLTDLLKQKAANILQHGQSAYQQSLSSHIPVVANEKNIAELHVKLSMVDLGEVPANLVVQQGNLESQSSQSPSLPADPKAAVSTDPTATKEYKAALELELWKESQEKMFEQQLNEKETKIIAKLTEDFRKRDMERELLCKKKITENNLMQQELQKMLNQLSKREAQIVAKEKELAHLEAELNRSYERKLCDLKESSRRVEEECQHTLNLAKKKSDDDEMYIAKVKEQLSEAEVKYRSLEKEFDSFKERQHGKPEVKLQAEINLLTLEKVELERRLEACNKSKAHYKQQWGRALKENAKLKEKSDQEAKLFAQKQIQELEMLKNRLLAAEEKDVIKMERKELFDIKEELNRQQLEMMGKKSKEPLTERNSDNKQQSTLEDQLQRLQEERDNLLKTGLFNTDDEMIVELEQRINAIIQNIDNAV